MNKYLKKIKTFKKKFKKKNQNKNRNFLKKKYI